MKTNLNALVLSGALIVLLSMTLVSCGGSDHAAEGESGKPITHIIELYQAENSDGVIECFGTPDTTRASVGDLLLFYTELDTAMVKDLGVRPETQANLNQKFGARGGPLTNRTKVIHLGRNEYVGARISPGAGGLYKPPVQCGDSDDDPPKVIIR